MKKVKEKVDPKILKSGKNGKAVQRDEPKKSKIIKVVDLAGMVGLSTQAVYKKISSGQIIRRADGRIDLAETTNRQFLKNFSRSEGGRPISATSTPRDPETTELKKEKLVRQCLLLQGAIQNDNLLSVSRARDYFEKHLEFCGIEDEVFVEELCRLISEFFGTEPSPEITNQLATAIRDRLAVILKNKRQTVEKFFSSLKKAPDVDVIPQNLSKRASKIPADIKAMVEAGLTLENLSDLPTLAAVQKVKLLLEIRQIENKISFQKGDTVSIDFFRDVKNAIDGIDQGQYLQIAWGLTGIIQEIFQTHDDQKLFEIQNKIWILSYEPVVRVQQRIEQYLSKLSESMPPRA